MRYATYLVGVALVLWAASTASPVLACNGHGASVAAAINDFFSQNGESPGADGSGNRGNDEVRLDGTVDGDHVSGTFNGRGGNGGNSADAFNQAVDAMLGTDFGHGFQQNSTDYVDYNG